MKPIPASGMGFFLFKLLGTGIDFQCGCGVCSRHSRQRSANASFDSSTLDRYRLLCLLRAAGWQSFAIRI